MLSPDALRTSFVECNDEGVKVAPNRSMLQRNLWQFLKFGLVGGSGVIVNNVIFIICSKIGAGFSVFPTSPFVNLFGSQFHVRWIHVFMTVAFLVANLWNFQLNRMWTFRASQRRGWFREFASFLATGILAFCVSLAVATLLINPTSPLHLPEHIFDGSSGLRTASYWANLIATLVSMPINFVVNKIWTFRSAKPTVVVDEPLA